MSSCLLDIYCKMIIHNFAHFFSYWIVCLADLYTYFKKDILLYLYVACLFTLITVYFDKQKFFTVACLFTLVMVYFDKQKFFILTQSNLSIFPYMINILWCVCYLRISAIPRLGICFSMLSFRCLIFHTLKSDFAFCVSW